MGLLFPKVNGACIKFLECGKYIYAVFLGPLFTNVNKTFLNIQKQFLVQISILTRFSKSNKHLANDLTRCNKHLNNMYHSGFTKIQRSIWLTIVKMRNINASKIDPYHVLLLITPQLKNHFKQTICKTFGNCPQVNTP